MLQSDEAIVAEDHLELGAGTNPGFGTIFGFLGGIPRCCSSWNHRYLISGGFLFSYEASLFESGERLHRQLLKLLEECFVMVFEVEERLALHAGLQLLRHVVEQPGVSVNPHEVIAHVSFPDLYPRDTYQRFLCVAAPRAVRRDRRRLPGNNGWANPPSPIALRNTSEGFPAT